MGSDGVGKERPFFLYNVARVMNSVSTTESNNNKLLSVTEFAAAIGKTERQVYRYVSQGRVASQEGVGRGGVRIPESEVAKFLDGNNNSASGSWTRVRGGSRRSREDYFEDNLESMSLAKDESAKDSENIRNSSSEGKTSAASFEYIEAVEEPGEAVSQEESQGASEPAPEPHFPSSVPLERHEAAVMRLGYMQSQLEQVQRLLTDGTQKDKEKDEKLQAMIKDLDEAQREILRLGAKIEVANESKKEAEMRANQLAVRLEDAERRANLPWWKRIFI